MRRTILLSSTSTALILGLFLPLCAQEIALTSDSLDHTCPQWSPDGNWIVYEKYDAENMQIFRVASTGGTEIPLTSDSYEHFSPQWSPDGNWIAYQKRDETYHWQIYKIPFGASIDEDPGKVTNISPSLRLLKNPVGGNYIEVLLTSAEHNQAEITLYNQIGQKLNTYQFNGLKAGENRLKLYVADFPTGIYFLKLNGKPVGKVVKVK